MCVVDNSCNIISISFVLAFNRKFDVLVTNIDFSLAAD